MEEAAVWSRQGGIEALIASRRLWSVLFKLTIVVAAVLAVLVFAFAAFVVVLPLALAGGFALHLYIRHKLRQAAHRRGPSDNLVIDAEYTIIDRAPDDTQQSQAYSPHREERLP